ncbi:MAG: hypothetical protein B6I32_06175, partial [Desulfobacterium sp. 4572_20]
MTQMLRFRVIYERNYILSMGMRQKRHTHAPLNDMQHFLKCCPNLLQQKFTNCKNTPSPLMGEGWGEGAPSPLSPPTRGGEISVFIDVQLSVCKF